MDVSQSYPLNQNFVNAISQNRGVKVSKGSVEMLFG